MFGLEAPDGSITPGRTCPRGGEFQGRELVPLPGNFGVEALRFNAQQTIAYLALYPIPPGNKSDTELYTALYDADTGIAPVTKLAGISTGGFYDSYPTITNDGQHIVFARSQGAGTLRVWVATADGSFDDPGLMQLALPAGRAVSNEPYVTARGGAVYFAAGHEWDLFRTAGTAPAFGAAPMPVPGVNVAGTVEAAPVVSDDELEIFFASDRHDPGGSFVDLDLYTATRDSPTASFGAPRRLTQLSAANTDWPAWISPSGCELYYLNRDEAAPNHPKLYVARR